MKSGRYRFGQPGQTTGIENIVSALIRPSRTRFQRLYITDFLTPVVLVAGVFGRRRLVVPSWFQPLDHGGGSGSHFQAAEIRMRPSGHDSPARGSSLITAMIPACVSTSSPTRKLVVLRAASSVLLHRTQKRQPEEDRNSRWIGKREDQNPVHS